MSNSNNASMLRLAYSIPILEALETMSLTRHNAFAPNVWSIETFVHKLASSCHIGQLNDWHRLYIENTCASLMAERRCFCEDLPGGEYSIPLIAYVLSLAQSQYGNMSVIQCFRYGMMNYIHGVYGKSSDLVEEADRYWSEEIREQKQRVNKKTRLVHSKQLASVTGKNMETSPFEAGEA